MNDFAESLGLPSEDDLDSLAAAFSDAAAGLDAVLFPRERETLHREIRSYLAFTDLARAIREEAPPTLTSAISSYGYPHCINCGHATEWPVSFCHYCPPEDIERALREVGF